MGQLQWCWMKDLADNVKHGKKETHAHVAVCQLACLSGRQLQLLLALALNFTWQHDCGLRLANRDHSNPTA
jgi:hypothetical protein